MLIGNKTTRAIPTPVQRTEDQALVYGDLIEREHLTPAGKAAGLKGLVLAERKKLAAFKDEDRFATPPRWNGTDFDFAPKGEPGSIWELPDDVAMFLLRGNNDILELLPDDTELAFKPKKRHVPTNEERKWRGAPRPSDMPNPAERVEVSVGPRVTGQIG